MLRDLSLAYRPDPPAFHSSASDRAVHHQAQLLPHMLLVPGDLSAHSDSMAGIFLGFSAGFVMMRITNTFAGTVGLTLCSLG